MHRIKTEGGFVVVVHPAYASDGKPEQVRLIQESSMVGPYDDAFEKPGSSYLWVGDHHHLNREEVKEMLFHMMYWLENGHLHRGGFKEKSDEQS